MDSPRLSGRLLLSLASVLALATLATGPAQGAPVPAEAPARTAAAAAPAAVTFADEFDGPAGSAVDGGRWQIETGDNVNNHERQYYTAGNNNAALDGQGHLVITARKENPGNYQCWYGRCEYTSARLNTAGKFTTTYGRVEARMKIPRGQGIWPAFWMLGNDIGQVGWPNSGEIDIMENVGFEPGTVHGTLHGPGYSGSDGIGAGYSLPGGQAFADAFHTFAVDWSPNAITWSVDGTVYQRRTPADLGGRQWVFDKPFFVILNLAVGGYWPGDPDGSTPLPQQLVVDYVRVSSDTGQPGGGGGPITGLGGKCVDVAAAGTANGTAVQLYDCNGTAAQQWSVGGDGTIRALGKCLDVASGGTANGTQVQLWECNGSAAQQWATPAARDIVNPQADKCLDATGNSSANGTRLQIWTCTGAANQKWTAPGGGGTTPPAPGAMAVAPYLYNGWGSPPSPTTVMNATGVKWFTLAFVLSNGYCNPQWDGGRPLTGGVDQQTINTVRSAGGDVIPSFGGWSGNKLESSCSSAGELAAAYQKVIDAYGLKAIDIDIEAAAYDSPVVQQRTVDALKTVKAANPGIKVYVTFGTGQNGPDSSLIGKAAASGLTVDSWTIMPFNFGGVGQDMGQLTVRAAEGLKTAVKNAYGYSDDQAYRHTGISSMNGVTDNNETVTVADFRTILGYAQQRHLARLTFWSVNRDRPCTGGGADTCSGVSQQPWDFTRVLAQYNG
ncbi:ricin-type beta-trefoil lectin domain protein [Streptomyces sp. NRRL WC-3549]|uniref:ricin-type beta-trefoil lectin domain protein n=1 Tax=Streptomyces sp. NRRL WC-3549 TaxID=1463925 RepID=UPI0009E74F38